MKKMSIVQSTRTLLSVAVLLLNLPATAFGKNSLEQQLLNTPFGEMDKQTLLDAESEGRPEGLDVDVLVKKSTFTFNDDGTMTKTYRTIYKILTPEGVTNWAYTSSSYSPWYQNRPKMQVRVITPEGVEQFLDTNTIVTQSARTSSNSYSDKHQLSAPLPNIRVGAVVEESIEISDHKPYFESGRNIAYPFYRFNFTGITNVTIEYPKSLDLKHRIRGDKIKPERSSEGEINRISYTSNGLKPLYSFPPTTDPTMPIIPYLTFSSGSDWNSVATTYSKIVDGQMNTEALKSVADSVIAGETDSLKIVEKLVKFLHDEVRYTAYELGDKSIVPEAPAATLAKKYGDCKDKATLLTGLLRTAGFKANLALLSTGPGLDIDTVMPGIDQFNHAIVHLEMGASEVWIDATVPYAAIGTIPMADENRYALIASTEAPRLARTPVGNSEANNYNEDIAIIFQDDSSATIHEKTTASGTIGISLRGSYDAPEEQFLKDAGDYYNERYGGTPVDLSMTDMKDFTTPMNLQVTVENAKYFESNDAGASVNLSGYGLYEYLPEIFFQEDLPLDSLKKVEHRYSYSERFPVYVNTPHTARTVYRLKSPNGFVWKAVPDSLTISGYGLNLKRNAELVSQDSIVVTYQIQMDSVLVDTAHIDSVRALIKEFVEVSPVIVDYVYSADDLIAQGKLAEGLKMHREIIAKENSASAYLRYAEALNMLQFRNEAVKNARKAIELDSTRAHAHYALGMYYLHNELGQYLTPGYDMESAKREYEKAISLDSTNQLYYVGLYSLYLMNDRRQNYGEGSEIDKAIPLIEEIKKRFDVNTYDIDLLRSYLWKGDYEKADKVAAATPVSDQRDMLWVASRYLSQGVEAAERKAKELQPTRYVNNLLQAVGVLTIIQKYEDAYNLLKSSTAIQNSGGVNAAQIEMYRKVAEVDQFLAGLDDLERSICADLRKLITREVTKDQYIEELTENAKGRYFSEYNIRQFLRELNVFQNTTYPVDYAADLFISQLRFEKEAHGDAMSVKLYRGNSTEEVTTLYFEKVRKGYRLVNATTGKGKISFFSEMALRAIDEGKMEEANAWLDWGRKPFNKMNGYRDLYRFADAIKTLLPEQRDSLSLERVKLGAAALAYASKDNVAAKEILRSYPDAELTKEDEQFALKWYRTMLAYYDREETAASGLKALIAEYPNDKDLYRKYCGTLYSEEKYAELDSLLDVYNEKFDEKNYVTRFKKDIELETKAYSEVAESTMKMLDEKTASAGVLNNVAWMALFKSDEFDAATQLSEASLKMEPKNSMYQHTLAMLYLKNNDIYKAHELYKKIVKLYTPETVSNGVLSLLGSITKELELDAFSEEVFQKMEEPEGTYEYSAWHLINADKEKSKL